MLISELGLLNIALQLAIFVTASHRRLKRMGKRMLVAGGNAEDMCVLGHLYSLPSQHHFKEPADFADAFIHLKKNCKCLRNNLKASR